MHGCRFSRREPPAPSTLPQALTPSFHAPDPRRRVHLPVHAHDHGLRRPSFPSAVSGQGRAQGVLAGALGRLALSSGGACMGDDLRFGPGRRADLSGCCVPDPGQGCGRQAHARALVAVAVTTRRRARPSWPCVCPWARQGDSRAASPSRPRLPPGWGGGHTWAHGHLGGRREMAGTLVAVRAAPPPGKAAAGACSA